jgi:hypothetical protein
MGKTVSDIKIIIVRIVGNTYTTKSFSRQSQEKLEMRVLMSTSTHTDVIPVTNLRAGTSTDLLHATPQSAKTIAAP